MKGITFRAWRGQHYMTLAELLVRLGSFGLDLTWRVELDEIVDPRGVEMERRSADSGMDTLTLLSTSAYSAKFATTTLTPMTSERRASLRAEP
ncbi:hypothetical protein [Streptomyces sp. NPDC047014]|uniref:hypothetical protein n=1 Tax=Streptomyces sp. NPDC047014 TaxID=3155736 RepID=UPI0033F976E0